MAKNTEFSNTVTDNDLDVLEQQAAPYNAINTAYNPGKREREIRRIIWLRLYAMQLDPLRKWAENDWVAADQDYRLWVPDGAPDDWRADIRLPDGFGAIQTQMQETIDRKSRPSLARVTDSDRGLETYANSIMRYSMDRTGFDFQWYLSKLAAAIRGTSFIWDYWRVDKRIIHDPTDVDAEGNIKYTDKEITDFDDDYSQWIENEYVFIDPAAHHMEDAIDAIVRQVMHIDEFRRVYTFKPDFVNIPLVKAGGDTSSKGFFRQQKDMTTYDVEVLHYYNRANDQYWVMANNVIVRTGCIPNKHKEIPLVAIYQYQVPGRFWGLGIPKVIWNLTEERRSLRNLNLDRQKMQINKMFLVNDIVDIDEEEAVVRPHGFITINAPGLPLNQAIQPLEYGDVPASYQAAEEMLMDDIRRATGINDEMQNQPSGSTATEAAILKESSVKRINLISELQEIDSLVRLGKLKWSNIQFFYSTPRLEKIFESNSERTKKIYRKLTVKGKQFTIQTDEQGQKSLMVNDIEGSSSFELNPSMAHFMDGDYDVMVDADAFATAHISKAIQQSKVTEMLSLVSAQPMWMGELDPTKTLERYLEVMQEDPKRWMKGNGRSVETWEMLANWENLVMADGKPLTPTEGATQDHTKVHLQFTQSAMFKALPLTIKKIFQMHIMGEDKNNPATGGGMGQSSPGFQGQPQPGPMGPMGPQGPGGVPGQSAPLQAPTGPPGPVSPVANPAPQMPAPQGAQGGMPQSMQVADVQPSNLGKS